jgi:hypothetical protein
MPTYYPGSQEEEYLIRKMMVQAGATNCQVATSLHLLMSIFMGLNKEVAGNLFPSMELSSMFEAIEAEKMNGIESFGQVIYAIDRARFSKPLVAILTRAKETMAKERVESLKNVDDIYDQVLLEAITIEESSVAWGYLQANLDGGVLSFREKLNQANHGFYISDDRNLANVLGVRGGGVESKIGAEFERLKSENVDLRSRLSELDGALSAAKENIDKAKYEVLNDLNSTRTQFSNDRQAAVDALNDRLAKGAEALNTVKAMDEIKRLMSENWDWAEKLAMWLAIGAALGLIACTVFIAFVVFNFFGLVREANAYLDSVTLYKVILGQGLIYFTFGTILASAIAKGVFSVIFFTISYKILMISLSVYAQCRNKRSMVNSMNAIFTTGNASLNKDLSEIILQTAQEIVRPIQFKAVGAKLSPAEYVRDTLSAVKSVKDAAS